MTSGRPLADNERAVLERLLSGEFAGAEAFRAQIAATSVTGECECGCGSLYLARPRAGGRWLAELEHVPGYGPGPGSVDPSKVFPDRG
jgi:hypothetical protein